MNSFSLLMLLATGFFLAMALMRLLTLDDFSTVKQLVITVSVLLVTGGFSCYALFSTTALMPYCVGSAVLVVGVWLGDKWTNHVIDKHSQNYDD